MHRASVAPCLAPSCKGLYGDVTTLLQRGRSCRAALRGWSAAQPQSTSSSSPALTPIAAPRLSPARQRRHTSRTPTAVAAQSAAGRQEEGERGDSEEFGAAAEAGEAAAEAAPPCIEVRLATSSDELWQAAKLRAEAYYAEDRSRFVGSLKKKFAEQELESLKVQYCYDAYCSAL